MSYKVSVLLKDLKGFENAKDCYYYNSKENKIYTQQTRSDSECRGIVCGTIRDFEDKSLQANLKHVKQAFDEYTKLRREAKRKKV